MNLLALLPLIGLLGGILATVSQGIGLVRDAPRTRLLFRIGVGTSVAAMASTFLVLLVLFLTGQVQYQYVFLYSRTDLSLAFKFAGTWAGREGSLVLWTLYLTAILAWLTRRDVRAEDGDEILGRARAWTRLWYAGIMTAFLAAVWIQNLFVATPEFFLQSRPEGNGLNPTLVSPFMLIHPPVMFMAYALTTLPAAAVLGHLCSGTNRWSTIALSPSRLNWLLYTFAMGLGGIWAYYTLGFGGYWAWDPVEVANLLPWLALTVFLHAQLHHLRHGRYQAIGPFLGILPLLLTLFSTISTRSGLWVSVHAFTDPTQTFNPDAPGRFLDILGVEEGLRFYVALWLAILLIGLALWSRRLALDTGKLGKTTQVIAGTLGGLGVLSLLSPASTLSIIFELSNFIGAGRAGFGLLGLTAIAVLGAAAPVLASEDAPDPRRRGLKRIDIQGLAYASILILGLGLLVIFLFHMAAANGWSEAFYTARFPWLVTPVTIGLLLFVTYPIYGRRRAAQMAIGVLMLASFAATILPHHREGAYVLALTVPTLVLAGDRVRRLALAPHTPKPLVWARSLLWIAALLAVVFWINPPSRIGFGPLSWQAVWPTQLFFGAAAFYGLHRTQKHMTASDAHPGRTHLLVGALAGFGVGAVLAAVAWGLERKHRSRKPNPKNPGRQLRQVALMGSHAVVLLVLVGYGTTTYFGTEDQLTFVLDEPANVGGETLTFNGLRTDIQGPFAASLHPQVHVAGLGTGEGTLYWEDQTGSHFPLPATLRAWNRDVYFAVDGICFDTNCTSANAFVRAYEPSGRVFAGDTEATQVQLQVFTLPGLSLVWAAIGLFVYWMGLLMATPEPPTQRLSPPPTTDGP